MIVPIKARYAGRWKLITQPTPWSARATCCSASSSLGIGTTWIKFMTPCCYSTSTCVTSGSPTSLFFVPLEQA